MTQPAILALPLAAGHALSLRLAPGADPVRIAAALDGYPVEDRLVVGLGLPFLAALGRAIDGLRAFPALIGPGVSVPSSQAALWAYARAEDRGGALDTVRALLAALGTDVEVAEDVPTFTYQGGKDLSGFVDGTENPTGERALDAALRPDGSSFVAAQRWVHRLDRMARMSPAEQGAVIGRDRETNEELADAPASAHVKRAAQESFEPAAFMVRRSMPWGDASEHGLFFVAYGRDLDLYERVMRRMVGAEDGVVDALFRFSRPVSGGYYWCPPAEGGRLRP